MPEDIERRTAVRRLALAAFAALLLRSGMAVVTEFRPIFPPYYYTDATLLDQDAWRIAQSWKRSSPTILPGSRSQRLQTLWLAGLYRLCGHRPLVGKLANCAFASLGIFIFGLLILPVFGPGCTLGCSLLLATWPSNIFFTSQNLKESSTFLVEMIALSGILRECALVGGQTALLRRLNFLVTSLAILVLGFLRNYLMGSICLAALASCCAGLMVQRKRPDPMEFSKWAGLIGISFGLYFCLGRLPILPPPHTHTHTIPIREDIAGIPITYVPETKSFVNPFSPKGLTRFRQERQYQDRMWAERNSHRKICTQIFADFEFKSWLDVALFLPKSAFYVLFMPLPGLYPSERKIGRVLASLENALLLLIAGAALIGFVRETHSPPRLFLAIFFLILMTGFALLEFDLGSATRHRLLYFPLIFPFAVEWSLPFLRVLAARLSGIQRQNV